MQLCQAHVTVRVTTQSVPLDLPHQNQDNLQPTKLPAVKPRKFIMHISLLTVGTKSSTVFETQMSLTVCSAHD